MTEERFEKLLRETAREYNQPPDTPRDEIWARITAARRQRAPVRGRGSHASRGLTRWGWWPAAAALALVLGVIAGRVWTIGDPGGKPAPIQEPVGSQPTTMDNTADAADAANRPARLYARTTTPYLSRAEALLIFARGGAGVGPSPVPVSEWAADLLVDTRLLLDSPARQDEELRRLLEDLELVLVQIVRQSDPVPGGDNRWIHDSLQQRSILGRLRQRIPAGQFDHPA